MENRDTIVRVLKTLFESGDVFEIRMLDAVLPGSSWQHVQSGYFDYEHIEDVPNALANFKTYGGVYVTLNPVNPNLLGRANNRLKKAKNRETTGDKDILRRRWWLIDVDPVRPAGISATEEERGLSFDKAAEISSGLQSMDFPKPMCVNSGNGTQLLYRVDLPADDGGLIQRCLQQLSACSTDRVQVDMSVYNSARICRLPGTWNRKGDPIDTRPHRVAEIIDLPDEIETVPAELLHKLAGNCSKTSNSSADEIQPTISTVSPIDDFNERGDITAILQKHGWTLKSESDQQYWYRPGKSTGQHSATYDGTVFYVWSDNAHPFEARQGYNRFGVYKLLEYGGDDSASIAALKTDGYGPDDGDVDLTGILGKLCDGTAKASPPLPYGIEVHSLAQLRKTFSGLNKPVVHGLLREGETMNVIAAPKMGKSWLTMRLAVSIASGIDWMGFEVEQGKILHIDNELHRNLIIDRYEKVCKAMNLPARLLDGNVDVISLRGELKDIVSIGDICQSLQSNCYKLVIIDAFYRTLPVGTDENDNGAIAGIYNMIDRYAALMKCGFVLIHHSSKGNQSGKSVTDVGAGAGSQSRAADTHLVIRPHEEQDIFVMEAGIRSWAPIDPIALHWQWPLFSRTDEVDTSQLLGMAKPKAKDKPPSLEDFVDRCVAPYDPCSKNSIVYEAGQILGLSERKANDMLSLAMENGLCTRIKAGSRMVYVKNRAGISGEKSLWAAALLTHDPGKPPQEIAEVTSCSVRQVNRVRQELSL
ncbi:hypothetical protein STSP2_01079 [Anaerohalosphaera lusitana]|uniref:Regulatory protein RepA n=1 Tax=Anaerohalosphaera lusitana TaxID=1936003 RepID=A0A1U9NJE9_9BACT|nr:AAA family ATPase [Anaerohalosphaera lusitana]AQT67927.1 hypothetical protein STSP2_01079 [Anaerohalosphaera lusitana]